MLINLGFAFFEEIKTAVTPYVASEATNDTAGALYARIVNGTIRKIEFTDICPNIGFCPY